jgi:hypothetical protein
MTEQERKDLKVGDRVLVEHRNYKYVTATVVQIAIPLSASFEKETMFLLSYGMFGRKRWFKAYYVMAKL